MKVQSQAREDASKQRWAIYYHGGLLFVDSRKKSFATKAEAEAVLAAARKAYQNSDSITKTQYDRAEVKPYTAKGVVYSQIHGDGSASTRVVSKDEFIAGIPCS